MGVIPLIWLNPLEKICGCEVFRKRVVEMSKVREMVPVREKR